MHQTRKTHNAHNETQRRLKNAIATNCAHTYYRTPHYTYIEHRNNELYLVHPSWTIPFANSSIVTRGPCRGRVFESFEDEAIAKKHQFLAKKSKSTGRKSYYKFAKKYVHKWWRRKNLEEKSYSLKGSHYTPYYFW